MILKHFSRRLSSIHTTAAGCFNKKPCCVRKVISCNARHIFFRHQTPKNKVQNMYKSNNYSKTVMFAGAVSLLATIKGLFNFSSDDEEDKEDEMVTMIKRGILAKERESYDAAEQILHVALKTAQERDDYLAVSYIFDILANVAFERGEYEKSEALFKDVLKRIISTGTDPTHNSVIHISAKLCEIYAKTGRHDLAEHGYQFCIDTQEKKMADFSMEEDVSEIDTPLLYALVLDAYAKYLLSMRLVKYGLKYEKKALELCSKYNGDEHPQCLTLMNDVASMLSEVGEFSDALVHQKAAVDYARSIDHEELPVFLMNLGMLHLNMANKEESYKLCMESLKLVEAIGDKDLIVRAKQCINGSKQSSSDS